MNWEVFRAYDIRGIYPTDIDEDAYYRIAKGYVYIFKPKTMVVGMDARLSSPSLKARLVQGFLDSGVDVVDIGGITTDMLYYTVGASSEYSGGIVVCGVRLARWAISRRVAVRSSCRASCSSDASRR